MAVSARYQCVRCGNVVVRTSNTDQKPDPPQVCPNCHAARESGGTEFKLAERLRD